jgi:hypothetical protein
MIYRDLWWTNQFSSLSITFHRGFRYSYIICGINNWSVGGRSSETYSHPIDTLIIISCELRNINTTEYFNASLTSKCFHYDMRGIDWHCLKRHENATLFPLKPKLVQVIFKNPVRTSKRTLHFTITKINWLTLFKEIIAVYIETHIGHINTECTITDWWSRWYI